MRRLGAVQVPRILRTYAMAARLAPTRSIASMASISTDRSEVLANGDSASDSWRQGRGGFRVDSDASAQDKLTVQGDFYDGHEDEQAGGTSDTSGDNVLGRWSRRFSDTSDLSLQSYIDQTHLSNPVAPLILNGLQFAGAGRLTGRSDDV